MVGSGEGGGRGNGAVRLSAVERGHLMAVTARLQRMMREKMATLKLMLADTRKMQVGFTVRFQVWLLPLKARIRCRRWKEQPIRRLLNHCCGLHCLRYCLAHSLLVIGCYWIQDFVD